MADTELTLEQLLEQQRLLTEKIKELLEMESAEADAYLEDAAREARKVTIDISKFNTLTNRVHIKLSKYRSDIVDWLRDNYPYRTYLDGSNTNVVGIDKLDQFISRFSPDSTVKIQWDKTFEDYNQWLNAPDILLEVDPKKPRVNLVLGRRFTYFGIRAEDLPSWNRDSHTFSLAEFYLWPNIETNYVPLHLPTLDQRNKPARVEYSEDARAILISQLAKRKAIAELQNATDAPDIGNPFIEPYILDPHQRVAIKFLEVSLELQEAYIRGILAYDMGLGKSAIDIALCERHPEWKRILIICPANLKINWQSEIFKFTGQKSHIFGGIQPDEVDIDLWVENKIRYFIINYDVIGRAIGPKDDKVMKWVMMFKAIKPDHVCLDEAHYIKNMDSGRSVGVKSLEFKNVVPMSGTPLVNRPIELFPNLNIVAPDIFPSASQFFYQFTYGDGTPRNTKKLHEMMLPFMIRRTKKDVYGDKIHITRIPFSKELSPTARALYTKILQGIYISLRRPDYQRDVPSILAELTRCKQTCSADNVETSAELAQNAYEETEKKVIIFSQFKESQYAIEQELGKDAMVLNGDIKDYEARDRMLKRFQDPKDNIKYLVTNILEGLTMTEAHTVIFNDIWWTPKDHSQAEGRAFGRVNDPHGGNSYWIQNQNTIDQFLIALIQKKMAIFEEMVDGVTTSADEQGTIIGALMQHLKENM